MTSLPPTYDEAVALANCDGDDELFREIVEIYLEDSPTIVKNLKQAVMDSDAANIEKFAHALKGASGNICAEPVCDLAQMIERMGRKNELSEVRDVYRKLVKEFIRLKDSLDIMMMRASDLDDQVQ
ncbi:MAG: hypothetical protein COV66_07445 [Nitrospinae bacterium CG11_big_fil_rev_8_21_14_0_20_45_15]|nr:MAG: hypothetical protein COV66_07445 [Nitrospinae bacterium CG11_big_fil_rev_8_21_14_0_20_45_15]